MQNNKNDGDNQDDKQDKSRQINTIQRDMIMAEDDFKKYNNEKIQLESEIRALKKEEAHLKINLQDKQGRLSKVEYELTQAEAILKNLKKKLNLL